MLSDSLLIIFISMFTALLSEGLSWLLIYRTEKYKKLQSEVEKQSKKRNKNSKNYNFSTRKILIHCNLSWKTKGIVPGHNWQKLKKKTRTSRRETKNKQPRALTRQNEINDDY